MKKIAVLCFGLVIFASNASAVDFGIGAKVGNNGVGLDLSLGLTENMNLRFAIAAIEVDDESETIDVGDSGSEGQIDAELELDYGANALLLDWHAFGGGFRVTGGVMKNNGSADLSGVLLGNIVVDGQPIDQTDIAGDLGGSIELSDSYQPYIGIGWGRGAGGDGGFSLSADLGVAMLDPEVDLDATVNAGGTNGLSQAELDTTLAGLAKDAEDDLDDFEFWPVLAIGVNYAF